MAQVINLTKYRYWHVVLKKYNNVILVFRCLIAEKAFEKILGRGSRDNGKNTNTDLFYKGTAMLVGDVFMQNYISQVQRN